MLGGETAGVGGAGCAESRWGWEEESGGSGLEKGVLEKAKGEGLGRGGVRLGEEKGSPMQVGGESAGAGSKRGRGRGAPPGAGYHTMEETRSSTISPSRSTPSDLET